MSSKRAFCLLKHLHCSEIMTWYLHPAASAGAALFQGIHVSPHSFSRAWSCSVVLCLLDEHTPFTPARLQHYVQLCHSTHTSSCTFLLESKSGLVKLCCPKAASLFTSEPQIYRGGQLIEMRLWPVRSMELNS